MCRKLKELQSKTPIELLKRCNMDDIIPVDVNKLLEKMNIQTYSIDYKSIENYSNIKPIVKKRGKILGTVMLRDEDIIITYRKSDPIYKKRFTVAHELAHCCIGDDFGDKFIQFENDLISRTNEIELKCNAFAEELLIPKHIVKILHKDVHIFPLEKISKIFDVPQFVMIERLNILRVPYIKMNNDTIE